MRIIRPVLVLVALLLAQPVLASDDQEMSNSKPCAAIAKACAHAGFSRKETPNKKFWADCMKPVILGQSVKGVTVDADTVKACRANKVDEMKKELSEFEAVS